MNADISFLAAPAGAWLDWMWHMSWQVALLAGAVWLITRFMRRSSAAFRHLLWMLVFVKLLLPPAFSAPWSVGTLAARAPQSGLITQSLEPFGSASPPGNSDAYFPDLAALAADHSRSESKPDGIASLESPDTESSDAAPVVPQLDPPSREEARESFAVVSKDTARSTESVRVDGTGGGLSVARFAMAAWLAIAAGLLGTLVYQALRHRRRVMRDLHAPDSALSSHFDELSERLGIAQRFDVRVSHHLMIPAVVGFMHPTILLPDRLVRELRHEQLTDLIAHELAHVKRRDLEIGWLTTVLACLYWFHPAVWLASFYLRREREMACDDEVLYLTRKEGREYASTMIRVAESFDETVPAGAGFLGLMELSDNLLQRIRAAADPMRRRKLGKRSAALAVLLAMLLLPMGVWTRASLAQGKSFEDEIASDYSSVPGELKEFVQVESRRLHEQGLWPAADAYAQLSETERAATVQATLEAMRGPAGDAQAKAAAEAGALKDPRLLPALIDLAWSTERGDAVSKSRWAAVVALGRFDDKRAVPVLIPLLENIHEDVYMWSLASLCRLTGQSFIKKQEWIDWANAAGGEMALAPAVLEWANAQFSETGKQESPSAAMGEQVEQANQTSPPAPPATSAESYAGEPPTEALAVINQLPGDLVFHATYRHRSRGQDAPVPSTVWLKRLPDGTCIAASYLPGFNATYVAYASNTRGLYRYEVHSGPREGYPANTQIIDTEEGGTVAVTYAGGERDGQIEHLAVPANAVLSPNSRPDPYAAHMAIAMTGHPMKPTEMGVFDWDNSGKGMAGYRIRLDYLGQEEVVVPAGVYTAHHYTETQLTFGDTWYKKRPGHVTHYWILDNGTIVRILRLREPYELQLEDVRAGALPNRTGDATPEAVAAATATPPVAPSSAAADPPAESVTMVDQLPGELIFKGRYLHRSGGADLPMPSTVWLKRAGDDCVAASYMPTMIKTYAARFTREGGRYESRDHANDGSNHGVIIEATDGSVTITHTGGEKDGQVEAFNVPTNSIFLPNTRPDPYTMHMAAFLTDSHQEGHSPLELEVYDWDNAGTGMAAYRIRIEYYGQESIKVPAGVFTAHHYTETQLTFGDTWYKKRPGHVTEYWALDNGVVVRILRHREPYELLLAEVEVGEPLPNRVNDATAAATVPAAAPAPPPAIVSTDPINGATDVDPTLTAIRVTFDQNMAGGFSWTGGPPLFPESTDKPRWIDPRTCELPVKLEPGKLYRVGINSKSHQNFKTVSGIPAKPSVIAFTTQGADLSLLESLNPPTVVWMNPENGATDVPPATDKLVVTFDRPMGGGFSWTGGGEHYPEIAATPSWSEDKTTCTLPVNLKPNWQYQLGLNSPSHINFRSAHGIPLEPVGWTFTTAGFEAPRNSAAAVDEGVQHKAVIAGVISARETTEPAPGVQVKLRPRQAALKAPLETLTDGKGRYRFTGLPPGEYMVRYERPASAVREYRNEYYKILQLAEGETLNKVDFQPRMAGLTVRGSVRARSGAPIQGAQVAFSRSGDLVAWVVVSTDEAGRYEIIGLEPSPPPPKPAASPLRTMLELTGLAPSPQATGASVPQPIPVPENLLVAHADGYTGACVRVNGQPGEIKESLDFTLDPEAILTGVVVDSHGQPMADAMVGLTPAAPADTPPAAVQALIPNATGADVKRVLRESAELNFTYMGVVCTTDDQGRFELRKVPQGVYHPVVSIGDDSPQQALSGPVEVRAGHRVENMTLKLHDTNPNDQAGT